MRKIALLAIALLTPGIRAQAQDGFRVVVHADNPAHSIATEELSKIFLGKSTRWDWGAEVRPVERTADSNLRELFSRVTHGEPVAAVRIYWQQQIFSGGAEPPPELASDEEILDHVGREPGAVGYVSPEALIAAGGPIKVLEVTDGHGEISGRAHESRNATGDTTVAEHGDVRLFLAGACGPGEEGRRAFVENRNPHHPVRVWIETSLWVEERFRSSSRHGHTLAALKEEGLGCTRLSERTERRFALAAVSDAAAHSPHLEHRPARDAVAVVESGTCGRDRTGQVLSLINRHPGRGVSVKIEVFEQIADRQTRTYTQSLRLAAGGEKRLGCTADGRLAREFRLLRAEYR